MAYDEELANRLRELVQGERGVTEKRMFGGLAFLINGNLAVSASSQGGLLLRVDPAATEALGRRPEADRVAMRGRGLGDARPGAGRLAADRPVRAAHETPARRVGRARGCVRAVAALPPLTNL